MKTLVIVFLTGSVLAILLLGLQRKNLANLDARTEELRSEIGELKNSEGDLRTVVRAKSSKAESSQMDLEKMHANINEVLDSFDLSRPDPRSFVTVLPFVLEVVADCSSDDLVKLADLMGDPRSGEGAGAMFSIVFKILAIEKDPKRFVLEFLEIDDGRDGYGEEMRSVAISAWARKDPKSVLAWFLEQDPELNFKVNSEAFGAIGAELIKNDIESTVTLLQKLDPPSRKKALQVMSLMRSSDPYRLLDVATEVDEREVREDMRNVGLGSIFTKEGIEAGMAAAGSIEDIGDRNRAITYASSQSVEVRPVETMNWLMNLEGDREQAIFSAIYTWTNSDFRAVAGWLGEQEPSAKSDLAIQSFAESIFHFEPESALEWAGTISDSAKREKAVKKHYLRWETQDAKAARQWKESRGDQ